VWRPAAGLRRSAALRPLIDRLRPHYRSLRTAYLRRRYPRGGYVWGNGVRVFADFSGASRESSGVDSSSVPRGISRPVSASVFLRSVLLCGSVTISCR